MFRLLATCPPQLSGSHEVNELHAHLAFPEQELSRVRTVRKRPKSDVRCRTGRVEEEALALAKCKCVPGIIGRHDEHTKVIDLTQNE